MRMLFRALRRAQFSYEPLIEVRISRDALLHNMRVFQNAHPTLAIAPVLKSNAYGHGLVHVASILDPFGASFFAVDSYYEALVLRNEGIRTPLLIIGYAAVDTIIQSRLRDVSFVMTSLDQLRELSSRVKAPLAIHLKIDTGMHRQGIAFEEINEALHIISRSAHIHLDGVATHLADADGNDPTFTLVQIKRWNEAVQSVKKAFPQAKRYHCAASAGSAFSEAINATVLRLGIGLYGINIGSTALDLKPALELRTVVSAVQNVREGDSIGYNCTYQASTDMTIALIPVGYTEGLDRRLSNKGSVRINGTQCPLVGRVSMNIAVADATQCSGVKRGDTAIVYSARNTDANTIEKSAALCGTISHELLVHINPLLRRTVV